MPIQQQELIRADRIIGVRPNTALPMHGFRSLMMASSLVAAIETIQLQETWSVVYGDILSDSAFFYVCLL